MGPVGRTSWRQKSREIWPREGDRNTGFFHRMTNSHKKGNNIVKLIINGILITKEEELKQVIVNAFKSLLLDQGEWRANPEGLNLSRIDQSEATRMELPFSEEVYFALCEVNGDKASGSDDFMVAFWQFSWDFAKGEFMRMFKEFRETEKFVRNLNTIFIVMVPKKSGAENFKDFRPISLVGSLYKLLAKVLANRLKRVIGKLVNKVQNAFVEGRQILDASLIANEVIDSLMRKKERGILCKLDIEKAYDRISWNLIISVLQKMGFGRKWVNWIRWCISTTSFSILINVSLVGSLEVPGV